MSLLGIYIGLAIYGICSLIVDGIVCLLDSLNKKQLGALGLFWNTIIIVGTYFFRPYFPTDILFYVLFIISAVNLILNMIIFTVGIMTNK